MNIVKLFAVLSISFLLVACTTPYKQLGLMGGYSEMKLNKDTYRVSFRGNGYSSNNHVQTLLLRRCADLTISNGYKYFIILDGNSEEQDSHFSTPATVSTQSNGFANGNFYGNGFNVIGSSNSSSVIYPSQTFTDTRYTNTVIMKMLRKEINGSFDAQVVLNNFTN